MIKRRRFSEDIADSVLDKILEMGLKPGDRLPTHSQLSEDLGVSLPSLREGLSLLSLSGVINIAHGAGTTLANPDSDDYFKLLSPVSRIHAVNMEELSNFCILFIPDLAIAVLKKKESAISLLNTLLQNDVIAESNRFIYFHREFHTFLASSIENPLKKTVFQIAINLFYTHPSLSRISGQVIKIYAEAHQFLVQSLQTGILKDIEKALFRCYNFQILNEDRISIMYDSIGTGSLGGSFHTLAKRFSNILKREGNINIHLELTGGGIENIELTEDGQTIIALTQADIAEAAYRGSGFFSKQHSHLRMLCSVKPLDLWIVCLKDKKIKNLYDLKGRRIAMGAEGGDSGFIARTIFQDLDFDPGDYRPYYLSLSNALEGLKNDDIDVVFFLAHEIPSTVKELAEVEELEFLQIPLDLISTLEKENIFWKRSILSLSMENYSEINTISVATVLVTGSQVSEDLICRIAKILKNKSDSRDQISFSVLENKISIPFHTGVLECLK
jgi:uncharacterized protein